MNPIVQSDDLGLIRVAQGEPSVLVVSEDGQVRRNVSRALVSIGCSAFPCGVEPQDLALMHRPIDLYILDAESEAVRHAIPGLRDRFPDAPALVMAHDALKEETFDLLLSSGVSNVIARHGGVAKRSLIDECELITTCHKLFTGNIFGIEKYFTTFGTKVHEAEVLAYADKGRTIEAMEVFLRRLQCHRRIVERVSVVADELMTNAMFAAPRDVDGKPKYEGLARDASLRLEASERVDVRYACDGRCFLIGVRDRFGSLKRSSILQYLRDHFAQAPRKVREGDAVGAGVGLHMVFDSATQLVFNIEPGRATEVVAVFYVRSGHKAMRSTGKSLNVFFKA